MYMDLQEQFSWEHFKQNHLRHFIIGGVYTGLGYFTGLYNRNQLGSAFIFFTAGDFVIYHFVENMPL